MAKIAFIGTGLIGAGLAEGAARRGEHVTVWNRTASKAAALAPTGVTVAPTIEEAVRDVERVHLALTDDHAVEAVLPAVLGASKAGVVLVDHTTASPTGTGERAEKLLAHGRSFLHCPVFMSPQACRDAKGIMLCSGPADVHARVEPALRAMTGELVYLGPRGDLAAAYKLFGNAMIISITAGLADVFSLARSLELPATAAIELFSKFNPAGTIQLRGTRMAAGDYAASFELTMARKDVRLMIEEADGGAPLTVLPAIAARMDHLIGSGYGAFDLGVLSVDAVPPKR